MCPVPTGPVGTTRPAKASRIGRTRATLSGSPPTITSSVPSHASFGVRLSGASTKPMPRDSSSIARRRVEAGSDVEQSTMSSGFFAEARPSGPVTIASTCGEPVTQSTTTSLASARALAFGASFAPRLRRSSAASRRRWARMVSGQPFSTILRHAVAHEPNTDEADPFLHPRFLPALLSRAGCQSPIPQAMSRQIAAVPS